MRSIGARIEIRLKRGKYGEDEEPPYVAEMTIGGYVIEAREPTPIKTNAFFYSPGKEDPLFLALKGLKAMKNGKGRRASAMNDSHAHMPPSTNDMEELPFALEEIDEMGDDLEPYRRLAAVGRLFD